MTGRSAIETITILADSRGFDTYYLNPQYGTARYGYDRTFPHLLRAAVLRRPELGVDVVHIPDHFRSMSVDDNIERLALTEPSMIVLLDGIWESLLGKQHFVDWLERAAAAHDWRSGAALDIEFGTARLAALFKANELTVGPASYARQQERIVAHFRGLGCEVVWLTLPIPPADHRGGVHFAGNHKPIPEWGECLAAINDALVPMVERLGGHVVDLHGLMLDGGGADACLIDMWHFTPGFHSAIARRLEALVADVFAPGTAGRAGEGAQ